MTLNNSMSITPMPPAKAKGERFEHGSVLGGKTRGARVSSQWKSTQLTLKQLKATKKRSEDLSDVIIRLANVDAKARG
jgi:hypothetical protein